ncbi:hypothetical protein COV82_00920 [Candidatus Peregrinibacteria bacterium CG11_big_fil_rev_8_21_14_0_20_46_8]|nr:MAG: hypothetical protein COV82_00920 [Candidatus Peregrinibacteria bacterium CG11_big_fil_rev_8_21_14_0_20_46_8]
MEASIPELLLQDLGLADKEIKILLSLMRLGSASVTQIALESGITRTHVYDIAEQLKEKGLVSEIGEQGVRRYEAVDYYGLLAYLSRKQKKLQLLEKHFNRAAPIFQALRPSKRSTTSIRFFEGVEGVHAIYNTIRNDLKTSKEAQELLTIFSLERIESSIPRWLNNEEYIQVPAHVKKRDILYDSKRVQSYVQCMQRGSGEHEYKIWPKQKGEFAIDTLCWGHKLSYIDLTANPSGVIIENDAVVDTFRMWFEEMWGHL